MLRLLRLRPDAKRADMVRVFNDMAMKLEAASIGKNKEIAELEERIKKLEEKVEE